MANFTALKTAINNAIKTNGNEEITGAILQAILDAMVETLGDSAINDLENAITTEVTNRENAVGDVAADLAAEALARANKDNHLDGRINQEEYNRANADAALSRTVDQGFQTLNSQMTALNAAISALNAAYQNGYLYGGIATPSSSPSNNKCFYIALQGGTYTNFGGVGVVEGINIIKNDSGWKVEHIYDQTTLLNEFYLLRQQVIQAITSFNPIVIEGDVTNAPDEEDLTSNANHLLQFKNNAYSPLEFSGLGRKYLRKNIAPLSESAPFNGFVEGVNAEETLSGTPTQIFWDRINTRFVGIKDGVYYLDWTDSDNYVPVSTSLVYMYNGTPYQWTGSDFIVDETEVPNLVNCLTQDMINEANTIYVIKYDFTLKENITIPANCVLEFDGGSISGEFTLTGNNTNILGAVGCIGSIMFDGTWNCPVVNSNWWKDLSSTNAIKQVFNLQSDNIFNTIIVNSGTYIIDLPNNQDKMCVCTSNTEILLNNAVINMLASSAPNYYFFYVNQKHNITIKGNATLNGDKTTHTGTEGEGGSGVSIYDSVDVKVDGIIARNFWGDSIYIGAKNVHLTDGRTVISNCILSGSRRQGISVVGTYHVVIENCRITDIGGIAPGAGIDLEPNWGFDGGFYEVKNCYINNCTKGISIINDERETEGQTETKIVNSVVIDNCEVHSQNECITARRTNSVSIRDSILSSENEEGLYINNSNVDVANCKISTTSGDYSVRHQSTDSVLHYLSIKESSIHGSNYAVIGQVNIEIDFCQITCDKLFYSYPNNNFVNIVVKHSDIVCPNLGFKGTKNILTDCTITGTVTLEGIQNILSDCSITGNLTDSGTNSEIKNNAISGTLSLSGTGSYVRNNSVNSNCTIAGSKHIIENNKLDIVTADCSFSGTDCKIYNNIITMLEAVHTFTCSGSYVFENNVVDFFINTGNKGNVTFSGEGRIENNKIEGAFVTFSEDSVLEILSNVISSGNRIGISCKNSSLIGNKFTAKDYFNTTSTAIGNLFKDNILTVSECSKSFLISFNPASGTFINNKFVSTVAISFIFSLGNTVDNILYVFNEKTGITNISADNNKIYTISNTKKNKGLSADKPTLEISDVGSIYFATDLGTNGMPLWWNGTAWVDATGATV